MTPACRCGRIAYAFARFERPRRARRTATSPDPASRALLVALPGGRPRPVGAVAVGRPLVAGERLPVRPALALRAAAAGAPPLRRAAAAAPIARPAGAGGRGGGRPRHR